jgi:hypothetical protein
VVSVSPRHLTQLLSQLQPPRLCDERKLTWTAPFMAPQATDGVHYVEALRPCSAAHHTISQAATLAPAPVDARADEATSDAGS